MVAGDFLSVNLGSIAHSLNISDTLAGVTFLAIGNGSPDIFSTFAAVKSDSLGMAIGELIGAAAFITTVVAGSMALVDPFKVVRGSLIRDGISLMIAVGFLIYVMVDGYLRLWHCIMMLALYAFYVLFVMGWHWWLARSVSASERPAERIPQDEEDGSQDPTETTRLLPDAHASKSSSRDLDYVQGTPKLGRATADTGEHARDPIDSLPTKANKVVSENKKPTVYQALFPDLQEFSSKSTLQIASSIVSAPIVLLLKLTVPVVNYRLETGAEAADGNAYIAGEWCRWLCIVQGFFAPQIAQLIVWKEMSTKPAALVIPALVCFGISTAFGAVVILTSSPKRKPRWYKLLCIPGFIMSIMWISTVADEVVDVLKSLGIICNISEELLGLTVFAIGNSLDDLAANISVARHGHPVMALSACFGGPLLNILLGISVSGIYVSIRDLHTKREPESISLQVDKSLFIEAGMVLLTILFVFCAMIWTRWKFTKAVGLILIAVWVVGTIANVALKIA